MNITHWLRKEDSGLMRTALEIAEHTRRAGNGVAIRESGTANLLHGDPDMRPDAHSIHSQFHPSAYYDGKPAFMWMHGEPLSSVGNLVSMRAIVDLATRVDAFICMRADELPVWSSIKRTYLVRKGVDLDLYKPLDGVEKLPGNPAVLYCENWRGDRNPLYLCIAMQEVHKRFPEARLHLYNCPNQKMLETFQGLFRHNHWWPFLRSIRGPADDVNALYNRVDIVASCLHPLYARTPIEAMAAGKPAICPGYRESGYPYTCDLHPQSIADAITRCWDEYGTLDARKWAAERHDAKDMVSEALEVYRRYV